MTGMSYADDCDNCDAEISAAARFCPRCGARQAWFTDDRGERHDPGSAVRDAYRRMLSRARAVDDDPSDPRSFEQAFRLLVPTAHVGVLEEADLDE
ncbi:zinc ribbon domain-containing protein [Natrinema thermotolerans]|uniref:zinc ribbon domain-containing protein n=1 Tax=Natrinema thermotolerans TaxID=121872 RepID=UPI0006795760|nr:zinc ribbon domain-containing protein [Natrinema thermotolerans]QCC57342.1 hypothetical protein DVR14_01285 [Natrinema thermotolerans]